MKLEPPINPSYCATVVRVENLHALPNSDNLLGFNALGFHAIVSKDTPEGTLGLLFTAETQLAFDYMFHNNLHSHATKAVTEKGKHTGTVVQLNRDPAAKGYMGDNRRVRAIKLRENMSTALFMPITSLAYLGIHDFTVFEEGMTFDHIDEEEICRKYIVPHKAGNMGGNQAKLEIRVDGRVFPEHFETAQFFRQDRNLNPNAYVYVTQKLHGTSVRIGNVPVTKKLPLVGKLDALALTTPMKLRGQKRTVHYGVPGGKVVSGVVRLLERLLGFEHVKSEFTMVYGSHHAIKDANNPRQMHFYSHDLWSQEGKKLDGILPLNHIVYGELVGWVPPASADGVFAGQNGGQEAYGAIQKNYTYRIAPGTCRLFIYRICVVNETGNVVDYSWDAVKEFCTQYGLDCVPELWRGELWRLQDRQVANEGPIGPTFLEDNFLDKRYHEMGFLDALPLDDESPCDEGVCLRMDSGIVPTIFKAKSPMFYEHETAMADKGVVDIETSEDTSAEAEEDLVLV